ncbi:MAG: hypothetical protein M3436_03595 [Pseudomonadota bacterium]|nr:hypothetical protein [Pseudomonadota bacterium]
MGTVIRLLEQGARGRHADGGVPAGPGVSLPWMMALTPWWPAVLAFEFWSRLLTAHAAALRCSQAGEASPGCAEIARERHASAAGKVVPMAEFKARRVSS